jgi:hypothetical protein
MAIVPLGIGLFGHEVSVSPSAEAVWVNRRFEPLGRKELSRFGAALSQPSS